MNNGLWIILLLLVAAVWFARAAYRKRSGISGAVIGLRMLVDKERRGTSEASDLPEWESSLSLLNRHPSEYNQLNMEIGVVEAFVFYLMRHYPEDERISQLREEAAFRKDTVMGFKVNRP
ncbi:hypothetical protein [Paenibacillus methanolicus]|uniref:Uncharacterized protein n=1 Tax=Paenibacillus methanolicus TaxID=582686 RepID=A0A5S5C6A9_9BACL|nr:hypothetical protein [Paenibacillus methanolicus]TYP74012.1 hypothetical protein BCM02_106293 [Paenibacillus methanolicus]